MKILIVDDMKMYRDMLKTVLNHLGHEVIEGDSGEVAIELYKQDRPDLIILDVIMKGMNGLECAKKIREIDMEDWVPIIYLSGAVDEHDIEKGINAGGDDYLTKPFSEITLSAKITAMQRIVNMRNKLLETTKKLFILSTTDPLTGIGNRLQFDKMINKKIEEAEVRKEIFALLFIDLDHFKSVNDNLGHDVGDLLLKEITNRINLCITRDDFFARMGGDEFAVIIDNINGHERANKIAERMIRSFEAPFYLYGNDVHISASIGIACYPAAGLNQAVLTRNADIAMYHAKSIGRNNYQQHTEEQNITYRKKIQLESDLKFALEKNELTTVYQPIFNLKDRSIVGVEVLLRWNHSELGFISPNEFIPIAEESGLINIIGAWCFRTACKQSALWYKTSKQPFKLSINVSSLQLTERKFPELIIDTLNTFNISPTLLEIELTETALMTDSNKTKQILNDIHKLGVSIAIDDFGTGYSSLSNLQHLPLGSLKIDKSFIANVNNNANDAIIVNSIITLGKNLGLNVVAEGIETDEQLAFILERGCPQGQGFYLCPPLAAENITKLLSSSLQESKTT